MLLTLVAALGVVLAMTRSAFNPTRPRSTVRRSGRFRLAVTASRPVEVTSRTTPTRRTVGNPGGAP